MPELYFFFKESASGTAKFLFSTTSVPNFTTHPSQTCHNWLIVYLSHDSHFELLSFRFVYHRYLLGKPLIKAETIPVFEYRLDNLGCGGFEQLRSKIPQAVSLPSAIVGTQLEADLPEVRDVAAMIEIIQTTANIVSLVADDNVDVDKPLSEIILSFKIVASLDQLPRVLPHLKLKHLEPLSRKLKFIRVRRMIRNGLIPFSRVDPSFQEPLGPGLMSSVQELLKHVRPG